MIKLLKKRYPGANIAAIDYDPGASEVNQLNRIKLMLSVAFRKMDDETRPLAEGEAPGYVAGEPPEQVPEEPLTEESEAPEGGGENSRKSGKADDAADSEESIQAS
jgi:hypothetical protein